MQKHKYSDNCVCDDCNEVWRKALMKALDAAEKRTGQRKALVLVRKKTARKRAPRSVQ